MTVVLGLNAFHPDSAACVLVDGRLVAAIAEERLGARVKHCSVFPALAIRRVLDIAGIRLRDVEHLAIGHDNDANMRAKALYVASRPFQASTSVLSHMARRRKMASMAAMAAREMGEPESECRFRVHNVEHHLAHVASAFYSSPFESAAAFSYDGSGDFVSGMFAACEGTRIKTLRRVHVPHSLGFFYTAVCQYIGFDRFGDEYKVMGLSAYGEPAYRDLMLRMLKPDSGGYALDPSYFRPFGGEIFKNSTAEDGSITLPPLYSERLVRELGPARARGAEITDRDRNLASSCQRHFEDVVIESLRWLHAAFPREALVTAGGCALNGVCNARILRDTPFRNSYTQCAASDDGTALGAAQYVWHAVLGNPRVPEIDHAYWGSAYELDRMRGALDARSVDCVEHDEGALLDTVVEHLARGRVVGWYQGRSEWGPRALGNRSILAHPGWPGMKDIINEKIKRREVFRPFAPSILAERVAEYFEQDQPSPFMMHVVKIRPERRAELAAVCHEDSTGRLHSVKRSQNRLYYDLIERFARRTGTPVLLNTSFNENEPIVDTPEQAIDCYLRNDVDVLVLGNLIAVKPGRTLAHATDGTQKAGTARPY